MAIEVCWDNLQDLLAQWHQTRQGAVGHAVFEFLEEELRLMFPSYIRRIWSGEMQDEVLQAFLSRLVEKPLPQHVDHIQSYLRNMLRNHCFDHSQRTKREIKARNNIRAVEKVPQSSNDNPALVKEECEQRLIAISQLSISERMVLKLKYAPFWLEQDEIEWLAQRSGLTVDQLRAKIAAASDNYALSHIFDPGDDAPDDMAARRKRMERFRRRCSRAQIRLNELYDGGST